MPALTFALVAGLVRFALSAIGIGIVSFVGVEALLSAATSTIKDGIGASATIAGFGGLLGIDRAISLILSAYVVRISLVALKRFKIL